MDILIDRKLKIVDDIDIRVVVQSSEGGIIGTSQTGGMMQVSLKTPKSTMISAGVLNPKGAYMGIPDYVKIVVENISKKLGEGKATCFSSIFNITCTIEGLIVTQEEAIEILNLIEQSIKSEVG